MELNPPSAGGDTGEAPKLHIDDDWKAEAQAEKQRLAEKAKADAESADAEGDNGGAGGGEAGSRQIPKASYQTLLSSMASQALMFLGAMPDPRTGQRIMHLELARHHIDSLAVLAEKTKGNLTTEEEELTNSTVYELRQAYIQVSTASREQAKGGA